MSKRLLIVKAASDICSSEIKQLKAIAEMFQISSQEVAITNVADLEDAFGCGPQFDFIFLGAHANTEFFGESDGSVMIPWSYLGLAFCYSQCLNPGAILLLGCCRGGLRSVALDLFCSCDQIDYVCGPRWTVTAADISLGFHAFLYNMVVRREQPSKAVKRASKATGYDFFCHDRVELQREIQDHCQGCEDEAYDAATSTTYPPDR